MENQHKNLKSFICKNCGKIVSENALGTKHRNHCPYCLFSRHVDIVQGDRRSKCGGLMAPIGVTYRKDGEMLIVHQCRSCGYISKNRVAGDDSDKELKKISKKAEGSRLL